MDKVRRAGHQALRAHGRNDLVRSKCPWLRNPANMSLDERRSFEGPPHSTQETARAWAIKEDAMSLWHYVSRTRAEKAWRRWHSWAIRSRPEPVQQVARTIKMHQWGILNAIVLQASNGGAESIHGRVQMVKARSRGCRNRQRFRSAICFHLGDLDLYPAAVKT